MKKFISVLMILIACAAVWKFRPVKSQTAEAGEKDAVYQIKKGNLRITVNASGTIVSGQDVEIKSKSSGEIIRLPFDIGDFVKANDLIAELDPTDEQRKVDLQSIEFANSQASMKKIEASMAVLEIDRKTTSTTLDSQIKLQKQAFKNAENRLERQKKLKTSEFVSSQEFEDIQLELERARNNLVQAESDYLKLERYDRQIESSKADLELAKNKVTTAQLNLDDSKKRLEETKIFSPIDGYISQKYVEIGQIVASGITNTGGGTKLFDISDLSKMFIELSVDESDISKIRQDCRVMIKVDAYPDRNFMGKVRRIGVSGTAQNNIVTFQVRAEVTDKEAALLKPGMNADVTIIAESREDILTVPVKAVFEDREGNYLKAPDGSRLRVKAGVKNSEVCEIVSGVKEGDSILIPAGSESKWENRRSGPPVGMIRMRSH